MEMSPQQVRTASFRTTKKGFDPDEVATFLRSVAEALETAQNQSTAMEARARAAVARLQELTAAKEAEPAPAPELQVGPDQAETITRTLLLAQRTADTTVAEAKAEAERLLASARDEAATTIDSTREMSAMMLEEARAEARKLSEEERHAAQSEVQALLARRDFLEADVEHLEQFLVAERSRLREAATAMTELAERVPGGLGEVRRPLLSASDDDPRLDLGVTAEASTGGVGEVTRPIERTAVDEPAGPDTSPIGSDTSEPSDPADGAGADPGPSRPDASAADAWDAGTVDVDPTPNDLAVVEDPGPGTTGAYDQGSADDLAALARALDESTAGSASASASGEDPTPVDSAQQLRFGPSRLRDGD